MGPSRRICALLLLCSAGASAAPSSSSRKPNLIFVLQDDLGYYDVAFHGNANNSDVTGNITSLATQEGVILQQHYVYYWCSPTRRSFLTGRLPLHHGEMLSGFDTDDMDLRWSLLSQKLATANYTSWWFGKGHTGYRSMAHLPTSRAFANHTGYLIGMQSYTSDERWQQQAPCTDTTYSSDLYGPLAVRAVEAHDPAVDGPFFLYLPWQAVHAPHTAPPGWPETGDAGAYRGSLWSTDQYLGQLVAALKAKPGVWENTLLVYSSDNGGTAGGNNYPLRGYKRTNWEGGMRVSAFVSGGLLPPALRGTTSGVRMHVVDWYPTFCGLAGVDAADDAPVPPLPVDPANPTLDIYQGNLSWPGIDGKDVWDAILHPETHDLLSIHGTVSLSREVLLRGRYKLLTAERGNTKQGHFDYENGWEYPNGTWSQPAAGNTCGAVYGTQGNWSKTVFQPCLFDLVADPREEHDLSRAGANYTALLQSMWAELNATWLGYYHARSPAALMGPCDEDCANAHWKKRDSKWIKNHGPVCGVPGCGDGAPTPPPSPFVPSNSTACSYVEGVHYDARIPDGAVTEAATREACCQHCYESSECVAAAWHEPGAETAPGKCFLHSNAISAGASQKGVEGCITTRSP